MQVILLNTKLFMIQWDMAKDKGPKIKKERGNIVASIREELKKVTWPTRKEAIELTFTVVLISLIVALFIGIIDFSLAKILEVLTQR